LQTAELVKKLGVNVFLNNEKVVRDADLIIVTLKPYIVINVLNSLSNLLRGKIVVSAASLIPLSSYVSILKDCEVYRIMPNVNVEVNKGFIALSGNKGDNAKLVEEVFSMLGDVVWVDEDVLNKLTIISASIPALIVELIDAMELAALYLGIPHNLARRAVIKSLIGTAELAEIKDLVSIRNSIITPRGITIKLLRKYMNLNIKSSIMETLIYASEELDKLLEMFNKENEKHIITNLNVKDDSSIRIS
jgi:pyrroline-5-carboxylate reductase